MDYKILILCSSIFRTVLSDGHCTYDSGFYSCDGLQSNRLNNPQEGPIFSLEIKNSGLWEIPENAFTDFPLMKILTLNKNHIEKVANGAFNGLPNLVSLELNENSMNSLSLSDVPKLGRLEIKDNEISNLDLKLNELMTLEMDNNLVTNLSFVKHLPKLEYLHVNGNRLSCVDRKILLHLPLRVATLGDNPWENDCGTTLSTFLEDRSVFVMDKNDMDEQRILGIVSANENCELSNGAYSCHELQLNTLNNPHKGLIFLLEITNSSLRKIPGNAFTDFPSVVTLLLEDIGIKMIADGAFNRMPNLRVLHLSGNKLRRFSLSGMPRLERLEIKDNKILDLDLKLNNLLELNIDNNLVKNLRFLRHLPKLVRFYVYNNRLRCVAKKILRDLPLDIVDLGDNPWRNRCGTSLSAWLEQRNVYVMDK